MLKKCLVLLCTLTLSSASTVMAMEQHRAQHRDLALALCMAAHPRLGEESLARALPQDLRQHIMQLAYCPLHIVNLHNNFINPYFATTHEEEAKIPRAEVIYFRIRDITSGESNESPIIWHGSIAHRNDTTLQDNGEVIPTNAEIIIPENTTAIRIAVAPNFLRGDRIRQSVYGFNAQNLQTIEAQGMLYQSSSNLHIILHYNDDSQQATNLLSP